MAARGVDSFGENTMMRILVVAVFLMLSTPHASAGPQAGGTLAGAEICSDGACSGWVIGVKKGENNVTVTNGPTGGEACNDSTNFGFAVAGNNNMCQANANCDTCNATVSTETQGLR